MPHSPNPASLSVRALVRVLLVAGALLALTVGAAVAAQSTTHHAGSGSGSGSAGSGSAAGRSDQARALRGAETDRQVAARVRRGKDRAAFTKALWKAPRERANGTCAATTTFAGVGAGCRTADGLLRLVRPDGTTTLTHGPDYLDPAGINGLDATQHGTMLAAALQGATKSSIACVDAASTRHLQLVYVVAADATDHFAAQADNFRQAVYQSSAVVDATSRSIDPTAGRRLRVNCDADGTANVVHLRLPTAGAASTLGTVEADVRAALGGGTTGEGREHVLVFFDGNLDAGFAGIADYPFYSSAGEADTTTGNDADQGGFYALEDNTEGYGPTWDTLLHEMTHNMGAVTSDSPYSTGAGGQHCTDGLDVMCYNDGGPNGAAYTTSACATVAYDCHHDDYFNPSPAAGSYLTTHWNVAGASNLFLSHDVVATSDTTAPAAPTGLTMTGHGYWAHLAWNAASDNAGGSGVISYRIYRDGVAYDDTWPGDAWYDDGATTASMSYTWGVSTVDRRGNESPVVTVYGSAGTADGTFPTTSGTPPLAPTEVHVAATGTNSLTIAWTPAAGTDHRYVVYRNYGGVTGWFAIGEVSQTSFTFNALAPNSDFQFAVASMRGRTRSAQSARVTVTGHTPGGTDVTAPVAPTGAQLTGLDGGSATLSWNAVGDATAYRVYRYDSGTWTPIATTAATSYAAQGMLAGLGYQFAVTAVDLAGNESVRSATMSQSITAAGDHTPPSAVSLLGLSVLSNPARITVSWSAATDASGIAGYRVQTRVAGHPWASVDATGPFATTTTATTYTFAGTPGTFVDVRAVAVDNVGYATAAGNGWFGTVPFPTGNDTISPTLAAGSVTTAATTATTATLEWTAATDNVGVTGYRVFRMDELEPTLLTTVGAGTLTATIPSLTLGATYLFGVAAIDANGNVSSVVTTSATTSTGDSTRPSTVTGLTATGATTSSITFTWAASTDNVAVTGYRVEKFAGGTTWNVLGTTDAATRTWTAAGLPDSTTSTFRVVALDAAGNASLPGTLSAATIDGTPPTAPTAFAKTGATATTLTVGWTASTDVGGVTGYRLERNVAGTWTAQGATTTTLSRTITGLAPGTPYDLRVVALDAAGNTSTPALLTASTTADTTAPSAPGAVSASAITSSGATLTWGASSDDVAVTGYRVEQNSGSGWSLAGTSPSTTFALVGLADGTAWNVRVSAIDAAGNASATTGTSFATPDVTAPSAPTALTKTGATASTITIGWTAATDNVAVTGYRVERNVGGTWTAQGATTTALTRTVSGLVPSTSYDLRVVALDAAGNTSTAATLTTSSGADTVAPTTPGAVSATAVTASGATLSWGASTDDWALAGYRVEKNSGSGWVLVTTTAATTLPLTGLADGTTWSVRVSAVDTAGNASATVSTSFTTPDVTAPTTPTGFVKTGATTTSLTVGWAASTDNVAVTGYRLERNVSGTWTAQGATAATLTRTISGLATGVSYDLRVIALDAAGNASVAATLTASTAVDTTPPSTPGTVTASAVTGSGATLSWGASSDDIAVTGYRIEQNSGSGWTIAGTSPTTSYAISGLTDGTTWSVRVSAYDGAANLSPATGVTTFTTLDVTAPSTPTSFAKTASTDASLTAGWTASTDNVAVTGYRLERSIAGTWTAQGATAPTLTRTISGLAPSTAYDLRVVALDAAGNTSVAATLTTSTAPDTTPPSTPGTVTASAVTGSGAALAWGASTDDIAVAGYLVEKNSGSGWSTVTTTASTTLALSGLADGTAWSVRVSAVDAAGNASAAASTSFQTLDTTAPLAPGSFTQTGATSSSVTVGWAASTDNVGVTGYRLQRLVSGTWTTDSSALTLARTISGLAVGSSHDLRVVALDAAGNASTPALLTATVGADVTAPSAPTALAKTAATATTISVSWTAATDDVAVTGYRLERNVAGTWTAQGGVAATLARVVAGLAPTTAYDLRVVSLDAAGHETASTVLTASTTADTTVPSAPTGVTQTGATVHSVTIAWTASTDDVGIAGYRVETFASGAWSTASASDPSTTRTIGGLAAGNGYTMRVVALDAAGNVRASSATSVAAAADTTAPGAAPNLVRSGATISSITLAWDAATDDDIIAGYRVERLDGGSWTTVSGVFAARTRTVTGLALDTAYDLRVVAVDVAGNDGTPATITARTAADTTAPSQASGLRFVTPAYPHELTVAWYASIDDVGVTGYQLQRKVAGTWVDEGAFTTAASRTVTGLAAGTAYSFRVLARDAAGNTSTSDELVATTGADNQAPAVPAAFAATGATVTSISVAWNATTDDTGVAGYAVQLLTGGSYVEVSPLGPTLARTVTGLAPGRSYTLRLVAADLAGNRSYAGLTTGTATDTTAPSAPADLVQSGATNTSVSIAWNAATDDDLVASYTTQLDLGNGTWIGMTAGTDPRTASRAGLQVGATYHVRVRASDRAGNTGDWATVDVTTSSDTTAPSAPTNLVASGATSRTIDLAWDASSDDVGVVGYRLERQPAADAGAAWTPVGTGAATSRTATGLALATSYRFRVVALDAAANESTPSATLVAATGGDGEAPSGVGGLHATSVSGHGFTLSWSASSDDVGVVGYRVERHLDASNTWTTFSAAAPTTSRVFTGLLPETTYDLRVVALDAAGNESDPSEFSQATYLDDTAPSVVTGLVRTARTTQSITVGWAASTDDVGVTDYLVERLVNGTWYAVAAPTTTSYTFTGLAPGTSYSLRVSARDDMSNQSTPTTLTTATLPDTTPPTVPTGLYAYATTEGSISVTWNSSNDDYTVDHYRLERRFTGGTAWSQAGTSPGSVATFTALTAGTSYDLRVVAVDEAGNESAASDVLTWSTYGTAPVDTPPSAPGALIAFQPAGTLTMSVSWGAAVDADGPIAAYRAYLDGSATPFATTTTLAATTPALTVGAHEITVVAVDSAGHVSAGVSVVVLVTALPGTTTPDPTGGDTGTGGSGGGGTGGGGTGTGGGGSPTSVDPTPANPAPAVPIAPTAPAPTPAGPVGDTVAPTTPAALKAPVRAKTSFSIAWTAPKDIGTGVKTIVVEVSGPKKFKRTFFVGATATKTTIKGLKTRSKYTVRMRAIDAAGNLSPWSKALAVTTR